MDPLKMKPFQPFVASSANVQVSGGWVLGFLDSVPKSKDYYLSLLKKNNIVDPKINQWYPQQNFLHALKDVSAIGKTIFTLIGKKIPEIVEFPKQKTLKEAFCALDSFYKANHRGGSVGYYKFISYNEKNKQLVIESNTAYPKSLSIGLFQYLWKNYKPEGEIYHPKIDSKEDGEIVTYTIDWS